MEEGQIQIHTENIFPIIKKAVYSDHEIFLRELISNSVDAINKRRMASMSGDCSEGEDGLIEIKINRDEKTLTISDNGIGMNIEEVKKYINQVAFSSAEEFLEKYKKGNEEIIGHFGLGFYSSFMVAKNVKLVSLSAKVNSKAIKWECDGSPKFTIEECERSEPGTDVILSLMDEELEYIEPARIKNLITKYCDFMPVRIEFEGELINKIESPWKKSSNELSDEDYISFYKYLYPFQGDPLMWVHLKTDYPYNLQGILYFPKTTGRTDWEKGEIKLYCNGVYVSDTIKEIVPRYLLPLRGVIDSPDIPLNVSRSALQTDRRVRSIGGFVAKKIASQLKSIKSEKPNFYAEAWDSIGPFIKLGVMEDEKFADQVESLVLFGTTANSEQEKESDLINYADNSYTTLENYVNRIEDQQNKKVIYCTDEISQANALNLWRSQQVEVLKAETVIDAQYIPWLEERHNDITFQRVDADLADNLTDLENEVADNNGEKDSEKLHELIKKSLSNDKITVKVQSLKGEESPPALILLPEQMRRINDIGALMEQRLPGLPDHHVLVINQKHPLVKGLIKLNTGVVVVGNLEESPSKKLSKEIARHIYDMARLSVGGLDPKELVEFQKRSSLIMGKLVEDSH